MSLLLAAGLVLLALYGVPLFVVLATIALLAFHAEGYDTAAVTLEMTRLASSPMLVAIPLFTFAGYVFSEAGTPGRIVRLSRALLGWFPGGLAIVGLGACAVFTAFTGASGVTIIAMGGLLLPALREDGYPQRFSLGLLTTSGSLGLLFPPSLPIILFAYVASVSVDELFRAGVVPGILLIGLLSLYAMRVGRGIRQRRRRSAVEVWRAVRAAAWELPLPVVVLGGIYSGTITITEAAAITAFYALVVEFLVYRDIPLRALPRVMSESMTLVGGILIILAAALGLTNYLVDAEVPFVILDWMQQYVSSPLVFLLMLNAFLLVVGCLMDIFSALIVVVPLIVPIAEGYGVNLLHLGIIFLTNLEIGYSTPPVGLNLFIASFRFRQPVTTLYRASLPFLAILLVALAIITYVPALSLFLVGR
ncbi:MAG: TRAP transporter large permease subunit [Candidatus Eiseniibacteriota bacterium]|jgi:tripartite ATP-independent transporter DctM subunit